MGAGDTLRSINIDLLYHVTERTFLSPFFTFWIPVIAVCQNSRPFFNFSLVLFLFVATRSFIKWTSRVWINKRLSSNNPIDWTDQLVLVTGGSDGLGRVLVETLAVKHISVIVLDLKPFYDQSVQEDGDVAFYQCDLSDPNAIREVAKKIKAEHGSPTILINNAGCVHGRLIVDLEPRHVQDTFAVNVMSHFYLLKEFLPNMIENKSGHIVTISSALGQVAVAQVADYCASKAASISLHLSLRQELDNKYNCHGVRTTLVCAGKLGTKMFQKLRPQNRFFFPEIAPHDLAKKILTSLNNQESQEIYAPFYSRWAGILRFMPFWLLDLGHYLSGSNEAMSQF